MREDTKETAPPAQSGSNTTAGALFTPTEGGKRCRCHPNSVKRIANDLKITPQRMVNGLRIFSLAQIKRIAAELARRRNEAL